MRAVSLSAARTWMKAAVGSGPTPHGAPCVGRSREPGPIREPGLGREGAVSVGTIPLVPKAPFCPVSYRPWSWFGFPPT